MANLQEYALQDRLGGDANRLLSEQAGEGVDDGWALEGDHNRYETSARLQDGDEDERDFHRHSSDQDEETPESTGERKRTATPESSPLSPADQDQGRSFKGINGIGSQFSSTLKSARVGSSQRGGRLYRQEPRTDGRTKPRTTKSASNLEQSQPGFDSMPEGSDHEAPPRQSSKDRSTTRRRRTKDQAQHDREQQFGSWRAPADEFDRRMMNNTRREFFCTLGSKANLTDMIDREVRRLRDTYETVPDWIVSQLVQENKQKFSSRCATWKSRGIQNFGLFIEKELEGNKNFARISKFDDVADALSEMYDTDQFKSVFRFAEPIVMDHAAEQWARYIWGLLGTIVRMNRQWNAQEDRRAIDDYSDNAVLLRFDEIGRDSSADDIRPRWKRLRVIEPLPESMSRQKKEQKTKLAPLSRMTTWRPSGLKPNLSAARSVAVLPNNAGSKNTRSPKRAADMGEGHVKYSSQATKKRSAASTGTPSKKPRRER